MDNPETLATLGNKTLDDNKQKHNRETYTDEDNQEWTIQRHWQHWEIRHWTKTHKTQQRNLYR